jgi:hypothetical protein
MQINFKNETVEAHPDNKIHLHDLGAKKTTDSVDVKPDLSKKKFNKKYLYIGIAVFLLVITGAGLALAKTNSWFPFGSSTTPPFVAYIIDTPTPTASPTVEPTPEPIFYPNPINGLMISEAEYNAIKERPFLAVMVQNNTASRPEFGLNEADIVYESLVESSITRFMAVYWSKGAEKVQSLRSARKYFVDVLGDYNDPAYMHIGYAYCAPKEICDPKNDALLEMNKYGINRLSDSRDSQTNELSFLRDSACEKIKAREHCAYSNTTKLWTIAAQKGWKNNLSNYISWKFVNEPVSTNGTPLTDFIVDFKSTGNFYNGDYSANWKYDAATNKYLRFNLNKTPFNDGLGKQIEADTIIYQKIKSSPSGDTKHHQTQETIGSGDGYVMQGGKVYKINWSKPNFDTKTKFTDAITGKDFEFQRGKIWVNLVPKHYDYTDNTPKTTPTTIVTQ